MSQRPITKRAKYLELITPKRIEGYKIYLNNPEYNTKRINKEQKGQMENEYQEGNMKS